MFFHVERELADVEEQCEECLFGEGQIAPAGPKLDGVGKVQYSGGSTEEAKVRGGLGTRCGERGRPRDRYKKGCVGRLSYLETAVELLGHSELAHEEKELRVAESGQRMEGGILWSWKSTTEKDRSKQAAGARRFGSWRGPSTAGR